MPNEPLNFKKSINDMFFKKFSFERSQAPEIVGENAHLCPGASLFDSEATSVISP